MYSVSLEVEAQTSTPSRLPRWDQKLKGHSKSSCQMWKQSNFRSDNSLVVVDFVVATLTAKSFSAGS